jgi:hypothetical protein
VTRREVWRWLLTAALGLAVARTPGPAAGSPSHAALLTQLPIDVEAVRAELAVDGVAVYRSEVDRPAVALTDRETRTRYAEASAAYREVREDLEQPVASRTDGDRIGSRLAAIRATLDRVRAVLEAAPR